MSDIAKRLNEIKSTLPRYVKLLAVSKFHPLEVLREAYDAGQRCFAESRVQEMNLKHQYLPDDIEWHFIGHLQTNKVKDILPYVSLIHSVDSVKILQEIEKQAARLNCVVDCLLEVHIAQEESKYGFTEDECLQLLANEKSQLYPHVRVRGLMGMATNTDNQDLIAAEFSRLKCLFDTLRSGCMQESEWFDTLSMGMSHDYRLAIEHGSTMVRIGTAIFGERE